MVITYDIAVDLTPEFNRQLSPKFSVSLGDHGAREFTAKILQGGEPFTIEEGSTVSIVGKKSDGHIFAYACTYADEYVYFTIEEQMTPVSGIVLCELSIIDASGNKVGSANFTYWVEPSPVTDGEASESDLQLFQQILDAADDLDDVREILDRAVPIAEQLGDVEKLLTAFPTEEASGSLLTLTDGADGIPAKKVTLNLSPHQSGSGDPSPDNVRPISGYTTVKVTRSGKNVLPYPYRQGTVTVNGVTFTDNGDGTITANGTATAATNLFLDRSSALNLTGDFIISGCPSGGSDSTYYVAALAGTWANRDYGSGKAISGTIQSMAISIASGATLNNVVFKPMIRSASFTGAEYEPYTAQDYDITIPTAAGTVYGGQLTVDDDGSGTLTVDSYGLEITSADVRSYQEITEVFFVTTPNRPTDTAFTAQPVGLYCNRLPSLPRSSVRNSKMQGICYDTGISRLQFCLPGITALEDAQTWVENNPLMVVYRMASPTTYTLTASQVTTLLGDNTIFMDADGTIDLQYRADTQKYIDSRISTLNANLAYIEDGTTASRTYSVGQYVLIGGQLYKVTSAIASGATFTIGTNVTATTVGTELTALN